MFGFGEVGHAISKLYDSPSIKDLDRDDGLENSNILNICIPFSEKFVEIVSNGNEGWVERPRTIELEEEE